MPFTFLILLLVAGPSVAQPPSQNISGTGPKVSAYFTYANAIETCASRLHVAYSYTNAPAKLVWTMRLWTDTPMTPGIKPDPYYWLGVGPFSLSNTVAIPPHNPKAKAPESDFVAWGELTETRYIYNGYPGGGKQDIVIAKSAPVQRPCRKPNPQYQALPH